MPPRRGLRIAVPISLSVVVPVLNEQNGLDAFLKRARPAMADALALIGPAAAGEFLFVDDGSTDRTPDVLRILSGLCGDVRYVRLSRNFGKEAALAAGLRHARGQAVIPMDVDLQDPPELMTPMVEHWLAGARVVNARRIDRRSDAYWKRWSAHAFYRLINLIAEDRIPPDVGDFRLLDRAAVDVLNSLGETARFNKGLFSWVGFRVAEVTFVRDARETQGSKWRLRGLWRLALDGITSTTTAPLRIWTYLGGITALVAITYAGWLVWRTLVHGADTPGYASIMVTMLMLGALNLLSLGVMGEYIGRIAREVRRRPLYIVEETGGGDSLPASDPAAGPPRQDEEAPWTAKPMRA